MIEVYGDVWDYLAYVLCIPTNGDIKRNGAAVMGRGVAEQATKRHPSIAMRLGRSLEDRGNVVSLLDVGTHPMLMSFPVKHHWHEKADLVLIKESAIELARIANTTEDKVYVLPHPGCGNGQLNWGEVKPVIEDILPNNVHLICPAG